MPISSKKINTVHNLITFSIVFTKLNGGGDRFNPPPQPKLRLISGMYELYYMYVLIL